MFDFGIALRSFLATINIVICSAISKIYSFILIIANINFVDQNIIKVINNIIGLISLFMIFKMALVIINYIINPDNVTSISNFVQKVIISIVLLATISSLFDFAYKVQSIILSQNIIGKIVLSSSQSLDDSSQEANKIGDEIAYYIVSNFLDYKRDGDLAPVFEFCPNIFVEPDTNRNVADYETYCWSPEYNATQLPLCAYYLYYPQTKWEGNAINSSVDSSLTEICVNEDACPYPTNRDEYYTCKSYQYTSTEARNSKFIYPIEENFTIDNTMRCGIRDGLYIYDLINYGRDNHDYKVILSKEILSASDNDDFFYNGKEYKIMKMDQGIPVPISDDERSEIQSVQDIFDNNYFFSLDNYSDHTCLFNNTSVERAHSGGDFVFEYHSILSILFSLVMLIFLIFICIDVAIRAFKFIVLQIIAPIAIVSNMDPKGSLVFKNWLKTTVSVYVQLFVHLLLFFMSILLLRIIMNSPNLNLTFMEKAFLMVGVFIFASSVPKITFNILNLKDSGFINMIKQVLSAGLTVTALGATGVTALASDIALSKSEGAGLAGGIKNVVSGQFGAGRMAIESAIRNKGFNFNDG